jgi:hypothetical protein
LLPHTAKIAVEFAGSRSILHSVGDGSEVEVAGYVHSKIVEHPSAW